MTSIEWVIEKVLDDGIGLPNEWPLTFYTQIKKPDNHLLD